VGHFEAADGGTLFLDEVGELPPAAQVKLLRVLAERKIVPVGGTSERTIDVRIVAATNRELSAEVSAGRFREDLYYRLNVVQIDLPPLRARKEDLPALVQHFVDRFATEYGKPIRGASAEVLAVFAAYAFPGNVRELQNLVERAVALESSEELTVAVLPDRLQRLQPAPTDEAPTEPGAEGGPPPSATPPPDAADAGALAEEGFDLEAELASVERHLLERALHATDGNRTQAARKLGITFRSLRYRLAKFGMDPDA
jgi:two-component system response regulator PilR (NtrC family)